MSTSYAVKQVILVRTDLNMRKGKIAAQVAHASMKVFLDRANLRRLSSQVSDMWILLEPDMVEWVSGSFAKIVLGVGSEQELLEAHRLAKEVGLPTALIRDVGNTEFHGVPTLTCCAIGPARSEAIDPITGPAGTVKTKLI